MLLKPSKQQDINTDLLALCRFMSLYVALCRFMSLYFALCRFISLYVALCRFISLYVALFRLSRLSRSRSTLVYLAQLHSFISLKVYILPTIKVTIKLFIFLFK